MVQPEAPKGFLESMFDETVIGPMLEKLIEKEPDAAKEYFSIGKDYVTENGQIDRQAFLKETTVTEKVWALLSIWLGDNCLDKISEKMGQDFEKLKFENFDEMAKNLDSRVAEFKDNNIIYEPGSELAMYLRDIEYGLKKDFEFKLPKKSSIVMPKLNSKAIFAGMKLVAKKEGVNLKLYSYDEVIPEPADNEVQIVMIDPELLPNPERPAFDPKLIENCRRLYERGNSVWIGPGANLIEAIKQPQAIPQIQTTVQTQVAQATASAAPAAAPTTPTTNPAPAPQAPEQKAA